jgi:hypothetical protein
MDSVGFLERAMGIELHPQIKSLDGVAALNSSQSCMGGARKIRERLLRRFSCEVNIRSGALTNNFASRSRLGLHMGGIHVEDFPVVTVEVEEAA